ncbi:single-stranded DNA-binding protein [Spirochaetia bacterium]|nr:single-stranded DNA-binding protein [Spirochaetia bacterium]
MNDLNTTQIEGKIVKDPIIHRTMKGNPICTFSIASNRFFKKDSELERETSFFEIEAWDDLAEICHALGKKGRSCRIHGRMKQDRWNAPDGGPRSKIVVVADSIEFRPEAKKDKRSEEENAN